MGNMVVPLRRTGTDRTPLGRIDAAAGELLTTGEASSLQAARIEAILTDLRTQRDRFVTVLTDLREREPEDRIDVAATNAALALRISQGVVQIDAFIALVRASMAEIVTRPQA